MSLTNGHFKIIFQVKLYWLKELYVPGDLNNVHAISFTVSTVGLPFSYHPSSEYYSTDLKGSVSADVNSNYAMSLPQYTAMWSTILRPYLK